MIATAITGTKRKTTQQFYMNCIKCDSLIARRQLGRSVQYIAAIAGVWQDRSIDDMLWARHDSTVAMITEFDKMIVGNL